MKQLNFDSSFMQFLSRCADLIILNVLWVLCCLPVITIGASTTALYRCMLNMYSEDLPTGAKTFFRAFKSNFKQSTVLFLIQCVGFVLLGVDIWCCLYNSASISFVIRIFAMVSAFLILGIGFYLYPLQAQFENSVKRTLYNSVYLTFSHIPATLLALAVYSVPVILFAYDYSLFLKTGLLWIAGGTSVLVFVNTFLIKRIFSRYLSSGGTTQGE